MFAYYVFITLKGSEDRGLQEFLYFERLFKLKLNLIESNE